MTIQYVHKVNVTVNFNCTQYCTLYTTYVRKLPAAAVSFHLRSSGNLVDQIFAHTISVLLFEFDAVLVIWGV